MPRPAPVTTATLPLSIMSVPSAPGVRSPTTIAQSSPAPRLRSRGGASARARVEGGDERAGEDEDDRGVVHEHREGDEDRQGAVDLVVEADALDVQAEELLGDLPEHAGEDGARQRRDDPPLPAGDLPASPGENHPPHTGTPRAESV